MSRPEEFRAVMVTDEFAREHFMRAMKVAKEMLDRRETVVLSVLPLTEPVTIAQRKFLHGVVLPQIAEQVVMPDGTRYTPEVWKTYFKKRFLPPKWKLMRLPGDKRSTPRRVEVSTETLGLKAYTKFINECIDCAVADWGVRFDFTEEHQALRSLPRRQPAEKAITEGAENVV